MESTAGFNTSDKLLVVLCVFWFFLFLNFVAFIYFKTKVLAQGLVRILRRWNQSGQKHAGSSDIVSVVSASHPALLLLLVLATFSELYWRLSIRSFEGTKAYGRWIAWTAAACLLSALATFKLSFTFNDSPELLGQGVSQIALLHRQLPDLIILARVSFVLMGISLTVTRWNHPRLVRAPVSKAAARSSSPGRSASAHDASMSGLRPNQSQPRYALIDRVQPLLTALLIAQTRVTNIPQFLIYAVLESQFRSHLDQLSASSISLLTLLFAHVAYFSAGGTNSISSIDLSNAYNGVASYSPAIVGLLLFIGNWAGPIWWSVAGLALQLEKAKESKRPVEAWYKHICQLSFFMAAMVLGILAACAMLRTHLFVWTVFSPKFLYAAAWVVWHLVVNIGLGYLLVALGK